jgi:predicted secreted Zn-dependent protease
LLAHEQGHYDICELFARKLRKELLQFVIPESGLTDTVTKIYSSNIRAYKEYQSYFDNNTKSGIDLNAQDEFLNMLSNELNKNKVFTYKIYKRKL